MERYFSVDNERPGKRKQMLVFIKRYLAKDDPELMKWVVDESAVVDEHLLRLKEHIGSLEDDIKLLKKELAEMETSRNQVRKERNEMETLRNQAQSQRDKLLSELVKKEEELREGKRDQKKGR